MHSSVLLLIVGAAFVCALANAYPEPITESQQDAAVAEGISILSSHRFKRATCDIAPGIFQGIGSAACAAHCLTKGFKGGWCDSRSVCNCRH